MFDPKSQARRLRAALARDGIDISHSRALEAVAAQHGDRDWNTLVAQSTGGVFAGPAVPILRIFDVRTALDFYCEYLGFVQDWEHRFSPDLPLYTQVRRSEVVVHLSEHYGDGSPNTAVWIPVTDVRALQRELIAKTHNYSRPGVEDDGPGGATMTVHDPFGNELRFAQPD